MKEILSLISLTKNNIKDIRERLDNLETNINLIKNSIDQEGVVMQGSKLVPDPDPNQKTSIIKLVMSSHWPNSIEEYQILDEDSEKEKIERGEGIVNFFIEEELVGKKFLDIGCGEGHAVLAASKEKTSFSAGYDIVKKGNLNWEEEKDKVLLTRETSLIRKNGPYDVILIYDVIDHIENIHPVDLINTAKQLLSPKGKIYIRFHPWCSRHGGHIYKKLNKAFAHFILNEKELKSLGIEINNNLSVYRPVSTYRELINQCGLKIISENIERESVENFFKENNEIKRRIINEFETNEFPELQMEMSFVDFILTHE